MLNVHNIDTTVYGICVDQYESIFMVCHNTRGKVNPVHCQKKTHGQTTNVMCEVTDCIMQYKLPHAVTLTILSVLI